jgi:hypothetical protein
MSCVLPEIAQDRFVVLEIMGNETYKSKKNHKGFEPLIKILRTGFGFWHEPKIEGMKKNSSEESKNIPSIFGSRQNHFFFSQQSKSSSHKFVPRFKTLLIFFFDFFLKSLITM